MSASNPILIQVALSPDTVDLVARRLAELQNPLLGKGELTWQEWMNVFLADLERASVSQAVELAAVSRSTIYAYRKRCPEFRRRWDAIARGKKATRKNERRPKPRPPQDPDHPDDPQPSTER